MPLSAVIEAKDIEGLLPAIDRRQPDKIYCIDGKNFKWTVQGPESSFGSRYIGNQRMLDPALGSTFRLDNSIVFCGSEAFYQYDPTSMTFYPLFFFGTQADEYPWFSCRILNKFYFCRKGLGVYEYNPATNHWRQLTPSGLPANPVSITQVRGRLVVLGETEYAWSAIENADDFTDSIATGVARQLLSLIGGDAFAVRASADGFLVWTSEGIVAVEFSGNQAIFRHEVLTRIYKPINPFCIIDLDEGAQLFCDKKGFFTTSGGRPEPFMPLFGEFLNKTLLPSRDLGDYSVFRMHHARDQQLLFFMVSLPSNHVLYEKSYCFHIPTQKCGSFDRLHYGFGELNLGTNSFYDYNFGYIDENGYFHRFTEETQNEITSRPDDGYFYQVDFDMPSRRMDNTYFMTTLMNISAEPEYLYVGKESGFYVYGDAASGEEILNNESEQLPSESGNPNLMKSLTTMGMNCFQIGVEKYPVQGAALDGSVTIGLFRFKEMRNDDQLAEILGLTVHSGPLGGTSEDWLVDSGEEDYLTSTLSDEDWGLGASSGDEYKATLIGTTDGVTTFLNHSNELENIISGNVQRKQYPGKMTKGIFHHLKIDADEVGDTFHIKTIEMTGFPAGRIR